MLDRFTLVPLQGDKIYHNLIVYFDFTLTENKYMYINKKRGKRIGKLMNIP